MDFVQLFFLFKLMFHLHTYSPKVPRHGTPLVMVVMFLSVQSVLQATCLTTRIGRAQFAFKDNTRSKMLLSIHRAPRAQLDMMRPTRRKAATLVLPEDFKKKQSRLLTAAMFVKKEKST